ncbi:hypothetical protein GPUN_2878 [Glaciecola punicea ACAM 611]|uniref:Uncharacterized protein n=1 Tax=Glaciecola punicea ACAM 611 TaxID=1121923 RepID=H5TF65_9ALTE|nr:hypothetical protein GPUN_2878 [Glaciecola punicea ACAM 611]
MTINIHTNLISSMQNKKYDHILDSLFVCLEYLDTGSKYFAGIPELNFW